MEEGVILPSLPTISVRMLLDCSFFLGTVFFPLDFVPFFKKSISQTLLYTSVVRRYFHVYIFVIEHENLAKFVHCR